MHLGIYSVLIIIALVYISFAASKRGLFRGRTYLLQDKLGRELSVSEMDKIAPKGLVILDSVSRLLRYIIVPIGTYLLYSWGYALGAIFLVNYYHKSAVKMYENDVLRQGIKHEESPEE